MRVFPVTRFVCASLCTVPVVLSPEHADAQCTAPKTLPSVTTPYPVGINGEVRALTWWDQDGPGPQEPMLAVGGTFTIAGEAAAVNVAYFDGAKWRAINTGGFTPNWTRIEHVHGRPNGELIVADSFGTFSVSRWDGSSWTTMNGGIEYPLVSASLENGDLVVGGESFRSDGNPGDNVARWNGTAWEILGPDIVGLVYALLPLPNGDLVVGGDFITTINGGQCRHAARWSPVSGWSSMSTGNNGNVFSLVQLPGGEIIGGGFREGSRAVVKKWNGSNWSERFGEQLPESVAYVSALALTGDGTVFAITVMNGGGSNKLYRCPPAGGPWDVHAEPNTGVIASMLPTSTGGLMVGGGYTEVGPPVRDRLAVAGLAEWTGKWWQPVTGGVRPLGNAAGTCMAPLADGQWLMGGFGAFGDARSSTLARWTGQSWVPLSNNGAVNAMATLPGGDTIVGGSFTTIQGTAASHIARYNGESWSALPGGPADVVRSLATLSNGKLVVAEIGKVWLWGGDDQPTWTLMGELTGGTRTVRSAVRLSNGHIAVAGSFTGVNGVVVNRAARWDGVQWHPMGDAFPSNSTVNVLATLPNGDLYAGGDFETVNGVSANNARWNGSTWSPLGGLAGYEYPEPYNVERVATLPGGGFLAVGELYGSVARFDGTSWHALPGPDYDYCRAIALSPQGEALAVSMQGPVFRVDLTGVPQIGVHPKNRQYWAGATLVLGAAPSTGFSNVTVQWRRNGVPISNGTGGASIGGGVVSGATGPMSSPFQGEPSELRIANVRPGDSGQYTAVFTTSCGSVETRPATVLVTVPPCGPADLGIAGGLAGSDGVLDNNDFIAFINLFFASDAQADVGVAGGLPGSDGQFDNNDFIAFINHFFEGC